MPPPPKAQPGTPTTSPASVVVEDPVFYDTARLADDRRAATGRLVSRVLSLLISVGISVAFYFFFLKDAGAFGLGILIAGLVAPVVLLVLALVRLLRTRQVARLAGEGLALGITRSGLLVGGRLWAWEELDALVARPRAGTDGELYVHTRDGRNAVWPLRYLSARPATLDASVRALSLGAWSVDFTPLGA